MTSNAISAAVDSTNLRWPYRRILLAVPSPPLPTGIVHYTTAVAAAKGQVLVAAEGPADPADADTHAPVAGDGSPRSPERQQARELAGMRAAVERSAPHLHTVCTLLAAQHRGQEDGVRIRQLAALARHWQADLIVSACAAPAHLAHFAGAPVLVVPRDPAPSIVPPPRRLFVASDGSDVSGNALSEAKRLAGPSCSIRVAHVGAPPARGAEAELDIVALEPRRHGESLPQAIVEAARQWRADLLIVGTHGGEPSAKWTYLSIAGQLRELATMPLLLVPRSVAVAGEDWTPAL